MDTAGEAESIVAHYEPHCRGLHTERHVHGRSAGVSGGIAQGFVDHQIEALRQGARQRAVQALQTQVPRQAPQTLEAQILQTGRQSQRRLSESVRR